MLRSRPRSIDIPDWIGPSVAILSILIGARYLATEPMIFEPGGWFALDGRRVLEAGAAWRADADPYEVAGFLYSPVAVVIAGVLSQLPAVVVLVTWLAGSLVGAAIATWWEVADAPTLPRILAPGAIVLFVPTIADLILVNVTVALVIGAWIAIRGGRARSGVLLGLLGVAFPKPFLVPIVLWLLIWRRAAGVGVIATAAAASLVATVLTGPDLWRRFIDALLSAGRSDLDFVGNYGLSKIAPEAAPFIGLVATLSFLAVLAGRERDSSLIAATAVGVVVAPYAGIYAALPMLLAVRPLMRWQPVLAFALCVLAIASAPWAVVVAVPLLAVALYRAMSHLGTPESSPPA